MLTQCVLQPSAAASAGRAQHSSEGPGLRLGFTTRGSTSRTSGAAVTRSVTGGITVDLLSVGFLSGSGVDPRFADDERPHQSRHAAPFLALEALDAQRSLDQPERLLGAAIAGPADRETLLNLIRRHWGLGSRVLADVFIPGATTAERDEFVSFQRASAPAELAARSLETTYTFSVEDSAGKIRSPSAVLHRKNDRAIPFEPGRQLASRIPGAAFVALEGADHLPWYGDAGTVARAVLDFAGVDGPEVEIAPPTDDARAAANNDLSARELEVLHLVAAGLSDAEIAERLVLSRHTVHRHVANIRTKWRLPSRAAAVAHAARIGLL